MKDRLKHFFAGYLFFYLFLLIGGVVLGLAIPNTPFLFLVVIFIGTPFLIILLEIMNFLEKISSKLEKLGK